MPKVVRVGDIQSGHNCHCLAINAITGSLDVLINRCSAVRVGMHMLLMADRAAWCLITRLNRQKNHHLSI